MIGSLLARALVVGDICAISLPTYPAFLGLLDAVDERLHALVVVRVRFHKIHYVEPISSVFPCVLHTEEVPLREAISAIVILQVQVVLSIRYLDGFSQISALKATLEDQGLVLLLRVLEFVVRLQVLVVAVKSRSSLLYV